VQDITEELQWTETDTYFDIDAVILNTKQSWIPSEISGAWQQHRATYMLGVQFSINIFLFVRSDLWDCYVILEDQPFT
jgi:hypothetical protein